MLISYVQGALGHLVFWLNMYNHCQHQYNNDKSLAYNFILNQIFVINRCLILS